MAKKNDPKLSDKLPALQFYPGDWKKDPGVQALEYHDRGVWFEMLLMMHESSERGVLLLNGKPYPEKALSKALGLDNQILGTTLTTLQAYGVSAVRENDGAIYSRRMVKDEKIRRARKIAGLLGGNPSLLNQNPTTLVKQKSTPSSSSSSSSSIKKKYIKKKVGGSKNQKKLRSKNEIEFPPQIENTECRNSWREWLDHKTARQESYKSTKSQLAQLRRLVKKFAVEPSKRFIDAIEFSIAQNYAGIFEDPDIVKARSRQPANPSPPSHAPAKVPQITKPRATPQEREAARAIVDSKFPGLLDKVDMNLRATKAGEE